MVDFNELADTGLPEPVVPVETTPEPDALGEYVPRGGVTIRLPKPERDPLIDLPTPVQTTNQTTPPVPKGAETLGKNVLEEQKAAQDKYPIKPQKTEEAPKIELDANGYNYGRQWIADYIGAAKQDQGMLDLYESVIGKNPALASAFFGEDEKGRYEMVAELIKARTERMEASTTAYGRPGAPRRVIDTQARAEQLAIMNGFVSRVSDADAEPDEEAKATKKTGRGFFGGAVDLGVAIGGGIAKGGLDLVSAVARGGVYLSGGPGPGFFSSIVDYADQAHAVVTDLEKKGLTDQTNEERDNIGKATKEGVWATAKAVGSNPMGAATMLMESVGSLIVPGGVGGKIVGGAAKAAGAGTTAARIANVATVATASGEGNAREAYDDINKRSFDDLKTLAAWGESSNALRVDLGRDPTDQEVKDAVARKARTMVGLIGSGATAVALGVGGAPVVGLMQRAMGVNAGVAVGGSVGQTVTKMVVKEGGSEFLEEGVQEAAKQKYTSNQSVNDLLRNPEVQGAATLGGILGAAAGGVAQVALAGRADTKSPPNTPAPATPLETPAADAAAKAVENVLAAPTPDAVDLAAEMRRNAPVLPTPDVTDLAAVTRENPPSPLQDFLAAASEPQTNNELALPVNTSQEELAASAERTVNLQNILLSQTATPAKVDENINTDFFDAAPKFDDTAPNGVVASQLMKNLHNIGNAKMAAQVELISKSDYTPQGAVFFEAPNHQRWAKQARSEFVNSAIDAGNIEAATDSTLIYSDDSYAIMQRKDADGNYRLMFSVNADPNAKGYVKPKFDAALATLDDSGAERMTKVLKVMELNAGHLGYTPLPDATVLLNRVKRNEQAINSALSEQVAPQSNVVLPVGVAPEVIANKAIADATVSNNPTIVEETGEVIAAVVDRKKDQDATVAKVANRKGSVVKLEIKIKPADPLVEPAVVKTEEVVDVTEREGFIPSPADFVTPAVGREYARLRDTAAEDIYIARRLAGDSHLVAAKEARSLTGSPNALVKAQKTVDATGDTRVGDPKTMAAKAAASIDNVRAFVKKAIDSDEVYMPDRQSRGPVLDKHIGVDELTALAREAEARFKNIGVKVHVAATVDDHPSSLRGTHDGFKGLIRQGKDGPYVLLTADRIANAADAKATINHEVLGHFVLRAFLAEDGMQNLATEVYKSRDPALRKTWEDVKKEYPKGTSSEIIAEETIARVIAGEGSRGGAASTLVAALLRKAGMFDSLTQESIKQVGDQATTMIQRQTETGEFIDQVARAPLFVNEHNSAGYLDNGRQRIMNETDTPVLAEDKFDTFMRVTFDRLSPLETVLSYAEQHGVGREQAMSVRNGFRGFISAVEQRTAELRNLIQDTLVPSINKLAKDSGRSLDEIGRLVDMLAWARHAPERNKSSWLETVPVTIEASKARNEVMQAFRDNEITPVDYVTQLEQIVRDDTVIPVEVKGPDGKTREVISTLAKWDRFTGLTNAQADALARNVEGQLAGHEEALAATMTALRAVNQFAQEAKVAAGTLDPRVIQARRWDNYVPLRGGNGEMELIFNFGDMNPYERLQKNIQAKATGRQGEVTNILNESVMQAQESVIVNEAAKVIEKMSGVITATGAFGRTFDPKSLDDKGPGNGLADNVYLYTDQTGRRRGLIVEDKVLNEMMQDVFAPKALSAMHSGAIRATSFMSRFFTTRNPFYIPRAAMLDVGQAAVAIGLEVGPGKVATFLKNYAAYVARDGAQGSETAKFLAAEDTERARMYKALKDKAQKGTPLYNVLLRYENNGFISYQRRYGGDVLSDEIQLSNPEGKDIIQRTPVLAQLDIVVQHTGTFFENASRQAVFDTLLSLGASVEEAALRSRTTTLDFHQRSSVGRNLAAVYGFAQTGLTGAARAMNMLSVGGQGFFTAETGPDGRVYKKFDTNKVNKKGVVALAAIGFIAGAAAAGALGEDEAKKLKAEGLFDHILLPFSSNEKGAWYKYPLERGMYQSIIGLGQMAALYSMGTHDAVDLAHATINGLTKSLLPVGRIDNVVDETNGDFMKTLESVMSGLFPTLVKPLIDERINRNSFGGELDNRNRMSAKDKYRTDIGRDSTAQFWKDVAQTAREGVGIDLSPEVYQHYANSYLAPFGRAVDAFRRYDRVTEANKGDYGAVEATIDSFLPKDRSANSYEVRKSIEAERQAREALKDMMHARFLDEQAGSRKKGDRGVVGENEAEWVRNNPEAANLAKISARFEKSRRDMTNALREARRNGNAEAAGTILEQQKALSAQAAKEFKDVADKSRLRSDARRNAGIE